MFVINKCYFINYRIFCTTWNVNKITNIIGMKLLFSITLVLLSVLSFSQTSNRNDDEGVIVAESDKDRVIKKSNKVSFAPKLIEDTTKRQLDMEYVF